MSDKETIATLKYEMRMIQDLRTSRHLARLLTIDCVDLILKYGPGPVICSLAITLGELGATARPENKDEAAWLEEILSLVRKSYRDQRQREG